MNRFILFFFTCFILVNSSYAQQKDTERKGKVHWVSLQEAIELQKIQPKPLMIDVYTKWCGPCRMMSQNTFETDSVAIFLNQKYYAVKFDAEGNDSIVMHGQTFVNKDYVPNTPGRGAVHPLAMYLNVSAYPTLIFMDEQLNFLAPIVGYKTPSQIEIYLKLFGGNQYKSIVTTEQWQAYEKAFVPTWPDGTK